MKSKHTLKNIALMFCFIVMNATAYPAYAEPTPIEEKITIENLSTETINGVRIVSTYLENKDAVHQKTLIPPGEKRSFTVKVWQGGSFTTNVHFRFENKDRLSRPFTATFTNENPITPVTLKFGGGQWGLWKEVIWDEPK